MLRITIPGSSELWDEEKQEFLPPTKDVTIQLEHSLVSVSRWESKWNKAFLKKEEKSTEEAIDYVRCMTVTQGISPEVYHRLSPENLTQINDYIGAPMTATYFRDDKIMGQSRETVTSELIYYWMIALNIPFECQKWHLNRLFALIKVCSIKNNPPKKMSKAEIARQQAKLNAARRKKYNSKG